MYNNRVYIIINKDLVTPEILEKSPNTLETARTDLSGNNIIIKYNPEDVPEYIYALGVQTFTHKEICRYLKQNYNEWTNKQILQVVE
jgi:hypothetical protein